MRNCIQSLLLAAALTAVGTAGEILLPSQALERDSVIAATYRTNGLATGKGELAINWTDVHGRLVDDRKIPIELDRKSTRLNSSHLVISYAVFCLKKKKKRKTYIEDSVNLPLTMCVR